MSQDGHWPDFRFPAAWNGAYQPRHTCAWCHGAAGISLARSRAHALGHGVDRAELLAAAGAVGARLRDGGGNFSLCHGAAGLGEALVHAAPVLDQPALRGEAEAAAARGWERFERAGRPWPCGTRSGATDPGLMLGEAGIGHFYLRLHAAAVPPVLVLHPGSSAPVRAGAGGDPSRPARPRAVEPRSRSPPRAWTGSPAGRRGPGTSRRPARTRRTWHSPAAWRGRPSPGCAR
jgi:hypothetical protein